jgi:hypothetical protein
MEYLYKTRKSQNKEFSTNWVDSFPCVQLTFDLKINLSPRGFLQSSSKVLRYLLENTYRYMYMN